MKAIKIERPNQATVVDLPMPEPGPRDVRIRVMASGICGTDIHILRGEYLGAYPVIPGHEFSGVVEATGADVTRFAVGDRVAVEPNIACDNCVNCLNNRQNFCLNWQAVGVTLPGGMAETVVAPEKAVFSIGDLSFESGAFVEPLSCVIHGVQRAGIRLADRVAILGAGPIGILLLQVIKLQGAVHVSVVEKTPARADFATAQGANRVCYTLDALEKDSFDVVVDATGAPPVMGRTSDFARKGGAILLFGVPPAGAKLSLDAFTIFEKGLTLLSSFTSVRNSYQAIALLQSQSINVANLISHRLPLDAFEHGITLIEKGLEKVKKIIILPQQIT
ncbi:MAG: zinc-dependent alcohol dehydrogenase family protein [Anaerolineae bacterium]|nr:zinc-dependent alcohol dehydrogenase family protein [Anaerolineae bacterium]